MTSTSTLMLALAGLLLGACSSSSSPAKPSDAGPKKDVVSHDAGAADAMDATAATDASDASDAHDAAPVPVFTLDAGTTWTSLYRDYFGPTGVASCAGDGDCHGSNQQPGYQASGYLCPSPGTKAECYAGMVSVGDGGADLVTPDASFSDDYLSQVLCNLDGGGEMPLYCPYIFTKVDLERIGDWVTAGALDN